MYHTLKSLKVLLIEHVYVVSLHSLELSYLYTARIEKNEVIVSAALKKIQDLLTYLPFFFPKTLF